MRRFALVAAISRRLKRQKKGPDGLMMVELAMILPLIFLLVWGMAETGVALYNKTILTYASRDAVRTGILVRTPRSKQQPGPIWRRAFFFTPHWVPRLISTGQRSLGNPIVSGSRFDMSIRDLVWAA